MGVDIDIHFGIGFRIKAKKFLAPFSPDDDTYLLGSKRYCEDDLMDRLSRKHSSFFFIPCESEKGEYKEVHAVIKQKRKANFIDSHICISGNAPLVSTTSIEVKLEQLRAILREYNIEPGEPMLLTSVQIN